ncbi:amino-acid permease BAT1-like protein [Haematococcus lacustris]|uniref:Amino-acid permease BAT1-like protein n=1 Tax=Haematococcus lacustris TaxID=44745 RepID=A0A699ZK10_HAELA|nr:amino-acid permease BAT1-like protein [Haematococcus lacustris]
MKRWSSSSSFSEVVSGTVSQGALQSVGNLFVANNWERLIWELRRLTTRFSARVKGSGTLPCARARRRGRVSRRWLFDPYRPRQTRATASLDANLWIAGRASNLWKAEIMAPAMKDEAARRRALAMSRLLVDNVAMAATALNQPPRKHIPRKGRWDERMANGGPVVVIWGWVLVSCFSMAIALCMAELVSAFPTSGGLYYWSYMLAPVRYRRLACWMTGWINLLGQASGWKKMIDSTHHTSIRAAYAMDCHITELALRYRMAAAPAHLREGEEAHGNQHSALLSHTHLLGRPQPEQPLPPASPKHAGSQCPAAQHRSPALSPLRWFCWTTSVPWCGSTRQDPMEPGYLLTTELVLCMLVALLLVQAWLTSLGQSATRMMMVFAGLWNSLATLGFCVMLLWVAPKHQSPAFVFTKWLPGSEASGITSPPYIFIMGLLMSQSMLLGYDSCVHFCEETVDAGSMTGWSIIAAVGMAFLTGLVALLSLTFSLQSLDNLINLDTVTAGECDIAQVRVALPGIAWWHLCHHHMHKDGMRTCASHMQAGGVIARPYVFSQSETHAEKDNIGLYIAHTSRPYLERKKALIRKCRSCAIR